MAHSTSSLNAVLSFKCVGAVLRALDQASPFAPGSRGAGNYSSISQMGKTEAQSSVTCPLNIGSKGHSRTESGSLAGLGEKG